ncbi:hypothetical protein D3C78_1862950 [compost metagenome]
MRGIVSTAHHFCHCHHAGLGFFHTQDLVEDHLGVLEAVADDLGVRQGVDVFIVVDADVTGPDTGVSNHRTQDADD